MDNAMQRRLLFALTAAGREPEINVVGVSMNPTFFAGDVIAVRRCDEYVPGDILVFDYRDEGLLVHRLVHADGTYWCKGDNAFRVEEVEVSRIAGKVVRVGGKPVKPWPAWLTELSWQINRTLLSYDCDYPRLKAGSLYKHYHNILWKGSTTPMKYKKTDSMDFIQTDAASLAVFDPDTGDTHYFDEVGIDILNLLAEPRELDELLAELCKIYDATPDAIRADVEEFLTDVVTKRVVCVE